MARDFWMTMHRVYPNVGTDTARRAIELLTTPLALIAVQNSMSGLNTTDKDVVKFPGMFGLCLRVSPRGVPDLLEKLLPVFLYARPPEHWPNYPPLYADAICAFFRAPLPPDSPWRTAVTNWAVFLLGRFFFTGERGPVEPDQLRARLEREPFSPVP
jgi:hypothetical protein